MELRMRSKGIRIRDNKNGIVSVSLEEILKTITDGDKFYWAILFSEVTPKAGRGEYTTNIERNADNASEGYILTWQALKDFAESIHQELDLRIIGALERSNIKNYSSDEEIYNSCDILIEMFDSSFWVIFSKDYNLIDTLVKTFKDIDPLALDWHSKKVKKN